MNFTNNPYEKMMKQVPRAYPTVVKKAPPDTLCSDCSYWRGVPCMGFCSRELMQSIAKPTPKVTL